MPSARVSKECAWMLDLDALPGLGFSAQHQDQVVETIFDRPELQTPNVQLQTSYQPQCRNKNRFKYALTRWRRRIGRTNKFFVEFGFGYQGLGSKDDYLAGKLNSKAPTFLVPIQLVVLTC